MIRSVLSILLPLLAVAIVAAWVFVAPTPLAARFAAADCRRVALTDAATGRPIAGAEDIVLARDGTTLIVSAQDRLDTASAEGGLYAVRLPSLDAGERVTVQPLHGPRDPGLGPFRPHGIALSPDGRRLALVNHLSETTGAVEIGTLGTSGWTPDRQIVDPRLCRANDLVFADPGPGAGAPVAATGVAIRAAMTGGATGQTATADPAAAAGARETLRVTLDRADCATSARDLAGGTGRVLALGEGGAAVERAGLDFANGIEGAWVAETRGRRLSRAGGEAIRLPGGPDNLTVSDGRLVVALHPKLAQTGLYLAGWFPRVASRIVAVDPATGAVEVLYDDTGGRLFSGATAAVLAGDRLVAGSAGDTGLLVCRSRP